MEWQVHGGLEQLWQVVSHVSYSSDGNSNAEEIRPIIISEVVSCDLHCLPQLLPKAQKNCISCLRLFPLILSCLIILIYEVTRTWTSMNKKMRLKISFVYQWNFGSKSLTFLRFQIWCFNGNSNALFDPFDEHLSSVDDDSWPCHSIEINK